MAFETGQRVGDYEIVQLLGIGGMGSVYRVRNFISDRTEAMKVLLPDLTAQRDLAIRFISEIRTLASFDHPNIALLHTAFQADNQLIMMMEFVEGSTLEQRASQGPMSIPEVAGYTYQALSALSYAHGRQVVHRDIKPANIMLTSHGIVKLMDFGIAKSNIETNLTRPGTTIGSLYYMSPEQVRGDHIDGRSDLYSVGIMLYELLAGRRPFEAETTFSILNQQLNTPPQPPIELNPALPRALNDVILHALAKNPDERYQTADNFRDALRPFCSSLQSEPGHAATTFQQAPRPQAPEDSGVIAAALTSFTPPTPQVSELAAPRSPETAPPPFANVALPVDSPSATPSQKNHKTLWIATGVAAAVLAMVGLAVGLPHLLGTHAAESAQTDSSPTTAQVLTQTPSQQVGRLDSAPLPAHSGRTADPFTNAALTSANQPLANGNSLRHQPDIPKRVGGPVQTPPPQQEVATTHAGASTAEIEEVSNRYTDISARAGAIDSSLSHLRRQQEAEGYSLRGDMDSADNRMQSYLRAADQDLRSSNAASAGRDLARAEEELKTLEKFLGH